MARLDSDPRLPIAGTPGSERNLFLRLYDLFRAIAQQVNDLSEGRITARHGAMTAAPTAGTWQQGDVVWNSAPTELGTAGAKYIITGWLCVAAGTPGTWCGMRTLTGN